MISNKKDRMTLKQGKLVVEGKGMGEGRESDFKLKDFFHTLRVKLFCTSEKKTTQKYVGNTESISISSEV